MSINVKNKTILLELKDMKKYLFIALSSALVLVSCSKDNSFDGDDEPNSGSDIGGITSDDDVPNSGSNVGSITSGDGQGIGNLLSFSVDLDEIDETNYSDLPIQKDDETYGEDYEVEDFTTSISITYSGNTATVTGLTASNDTLASTEGNSHVILKLGSKNLNIRISGSTTDGSLKIYSQKKYALQLDNLSMNSSMGSCINLQSSKRAYIYVIGQNTLSDATSYSTLEGEDEKGCIFGEGKLIFYGIGSLSLKGNCKHGICSDDYVHIYGANIAINSAKKDGIHTNDAFFMEGGSLTVSSVESNAIECEEGPITIHGGQLNLQSVNDAISASYEGTDNTINPQITIAGGLLKLVTSGDKAMGIKAEGDYTQTGGLIKAQVSGAGSKGISCNGNMNVSGGIIGVLTQGTAYVDNSSSVIDVKGAAGIKCDGTLTISNATLRLKSTGQGGKGISSDGDLTINAGSVIDVITTGKLYGNSSNQMGGSFNNSNSDNSSSPKGIRSEGNLTINGGTIRVMATGGENSEGIESKKTITINDGTILVSTYDDAINATSNISIHGGRVYCFSSNNDGIDSNGTISITGGLVVSSGASTPEEGFDCDNNTFTVSGGTFVGVGGSTSNPTSVKQSVVKYGGSGSAGAFITIASSDGSIVGSYVIPRDYSQMTILFSSPSLISDKSYTLSTGGTVTPASEDATFYGLTTNGRITEATSLSTFTASATAISTIGTVNNSMGGGMGGRH